MKSQSKCDIITNISYQELDKLVEWLDSQDIGYDVPSVANIPNGIEVRLDFHKDEEKMLFLMSGIVDNHRIIN